MTEQFHTHVYVDDYLDDGTVRPAPGRHLGRFASTDAPGGRPRRVSPRDQRPDGLLCRLRQDGATGDLAIYAAPAERDQRAGDPAVPGSPPPGATDLALGLRRRAAGDGRTGFGTSMQQGRQLKDYQLYLDDHYASWGRPV